MLYPKYQKYINQIDNQKIIPENWSEFVALLRIRSGGEMKVFNPYPYQIKLIELIKKYNSVIILKSRQVGVSQTILSLFLHEALRNQASSSALFMRNSQDASAISRRGRQMLLSIPDYAKPDSDSLGYLKIKNGGDLYFKNSGKEGSRSIDSLTGILFDECSFVPNIENIYGASLPSAALVGDKLMKILCSTPSAKSGFFWDKLNDNNSNIDIEAISQKVADGLLYNEIPGMYWFVDDVGCCKIIIHYSAHPIFGAIDDYLGYRLRLDGTSEEIVQREYNLKFIDSSVAIFSAESVRANAIGELETKKYSSVEYYAGIDVSTVGSDYNVCSILKYQDGEYSLVALYRKRQETNEYHLYQIGELLKTFTPNISSIEVTGGTGRVYLEQLQKLFTDLHFRSINTTQDTKQAMISNLQLALEKGVLNYPPKSPFIDELLSFRREGKKLEASSGKHDDIIMAVAFALWNSPFNESKMPLFDISKIQIIDEIDYSDVRNGYDN